MPIVSTPGQQSIPYTQPTAPTLPVPPIADDFVVDTATFTPPTVPAQQQPVSSRLQNLMSPAHFRQPSPAPLFPTADDSTGFPSEDDDEFGDDADDFTLPQPPMGGMPAANPQKQLSLSRMNEDQRRKAIVDAFLIVLGKEPQDRDFSYYRFSTLTEEGLIKSLLSLPEHKQMVDKAKEHTQLKQSVSDLDLRVKQLDTNLQSMQQELLTLQRLLIEKNRYIQQMRGIPVENQAVMPPEVPVIQQQQPVRDFIPPVTGASQATPPAPAPLAAKHVPDIQTKNLPGPFDEIKSMVGSLFGKRN